METVTWVGMVICITQSALFSGLNLAVFGITKLRLEVEASGGNTHAKKVIALRRDPHFLLTTILWGNVASNTLLAILSNSILAGAAAFIFSTFVITFFGEIMPQAYFSRHALRMSALLSPALRFYQVILFPLAKPTALLLDWWLGKEGIQYFREHQLREIIRRHIESDESDVDHMEGTGTINFLAMDDLPVANEGEPLNPRSIISVPVEDGRPVFPDITDSPDDTFLRQVHASGEKWVVLVDDIRKPLTVLDADGFLRTALFEPGPCNPLSYCHRPVIVYDDTIELGEVIHRLKVDPESEEDDVIDVDIILVWSDNKRIITGADLLGRLLRGIVTRKAKYASKEEPMEDE